MRLLPLILFTLMSFMLVMDPVTAQQASTDATSESESAPSEEAPADAEAPAEEEAPTFPDGLDDPGIELDDLTLLVIPLTIDQLLPLSEAWLNTVKEQTTELIAQQLVIPSLPDSQAVSAREALTELTAERGASFDKFSVVVNNLEKKGGDQAVVDQLRAYRAAILVDETQNADWRTLLAQGMAWTVDRDGGVELALRIFVIAASLTALFLAARIVRRIARRSFSKIPDLSKLLQGFLAMIIYWVTIAFGLMVVLSALGIDITPVFALVGGASFIIAFAFQDTLGNLASGLMIMINRPFDEGDYVTVAGTGGTVRQVSVVSTTVTTPDNQIIVIPNSKVWGDVITNVTASETRRVDLVFGIGYGDSIEDAQRIMEEVVSEHPMVLADPEPVIRVSELADSSVNFICRPWTKSEDYWTVLWDLTRQVKESFDAAGISIPFPQTDMHLHVSSGAEAAPLAAPSPAPEAEGRPEGAKDFAQGDEGADAPHGSADSDRDGD